MESKKSEVVNISILVRNFWCSCRVFGGQELSTPTPTTWSNGIASFLLLTKLWFRFCSYDTWPLKNNLILITVPWQELSNTWFILLTHDDTEICWIITSSNFSRHFCLLLFNWWKKALCKHSAFLFLCKIVDGGGLQQWTQKLHSGNNSFSTGKNSNKYHRLWRQGIQTRIESNRESGVRG